MIVLLNANPDSHQHNQYQSTFLDNDLLDNIDDDDDEDDEDDDEDDDELNHENIPNRSHNRKRSDRPNKRQEKAKWTDQEVCIILYIVSYY